MAEAFVLDTTLDPAVDLGAEEQQLRAASLALPAGHFVVFAKVETALYGESFATFRLAATHLPLVLAQGATLAAEDKSTVALVVEYVEGEAVKETVSLALAASLPWGGSASVHGVGQASVEAVKITALQVDNIQLTTHHESHVSDWKPH